MSKRLRGAIALVFPAATGNAPPVMLRRQPTAQPASYVFASELGFGHLATSSGRTLLVYRLPFELLAARRTAEAPGSSHYRH